MKHTRREFVDRFLGDEKHTFPFVEALYEILQEEFEHISRGEDSNTSESTSQPPAINLREGFQYMDTAPKDGRDILVDNGYALRVAHWNDFHSQWMDNIEYVEIIPEPEQWMAIPPHKE